MLGIFVQQGMRLFCRLSRRDYFVKVKTDTNIIAVFTLLCRRFSVCRRSLTT